MLLHACSLHVQFLLDVRSSQLSVNSTRRYLDYAHPAACTMFGVNNHVRDIRVRRGLARWGVRAGRHFVIQARVWTLDLELARERHPAKKRKQLEVSDSSGHACASARARERRDSTEPATRILPR